MALALSGCAAGQFASVSVAQATARYERIRDDLEGRLPQTSPIRDYCWTRPGTECTEATARDSEPGKAMATCIRRLSSTGNRPDPAEGRQKLEDCMRKEGWVRFLYSELTITY